MTDDIDGAAVERCLAAIRAAGFAVVPIEATSAMWEAGREADAHPTDSYSAVWQAMVETADLTAGTDRTPNTEGATTTRYANALARATRGASPATGLDRAEIERLITGINDELKRPVGDAERIMLCADRASLRRALAALTP